ncbi:MAG: transposase [Bacillota bacterium]|nr:transposase [Bacillota bacterium]
MRWGVMPMTRSARLKGEDAIYHVIQRGNNRQDIFWGDMDKRRYLQTLRLEQKKYGFEVYCYCLMDNHIHLLIGAAGAEISAFMKSLNISYVQYYNKKHECCGHLFQDRFRSEIVDSEPYLLQASKYIHLNPVKAQMVEQPADYQWSSYWAYNGQRRDNPEMINTDVILRSFALDDASAGLAYADFVNEGIKAGDSYQRFMRFDLDSYEVQDDIIKEILERQGSREDTILALKMEAGLSCREISRWMNGLSSSTVHRIISKANIK